MLYLTLKKSQWIYCQNQDRKECEILSISVSSGRKKNILFPVQELWIMISKMNLKSILEYIGLASIVV